MLPKNNRLKNKKDFESVFKKGKSFKEDFLFLKVSKNNLKNTRFGVIVSKKFSKKAVIRNQTRRKIKEAIRPLLPNIKHGLDVVIIVRLGLNIVDFWDLSQKVETLLKKSGVI
jgi:ribonuclease P protein component